MRKAFPQGRVDFPAWNIAQAGYTNLWNAMVISPQHAVEVGSISTKLLRNKARYYAIAAKFWNDPSAWVVIALIDQLEGGGNANRHLHNGDPLSARTVDVPAGRPPPPAEPPFTFEQSCADALVYDGLDQVHEWSPQRVAYQLENYNGPGYMAVNINSPYLWSFTNLYSQGYYTSDHHFDPSAVSKQAGAMAILKDLMTKDSSIFGGGTPPPPPPPPPQPPPTPPPPPAPGGQTFAGLALSQWVSIATVDPNLMGDVVKAGDVNQKLIERLIIALQKAKL